MPRKQPSGSENRKKRAERLARLSSGAQLMPRETTVDQVITLTGVIREKAQNYVDWKRGRISAEHYWVAIRALSALAAAIASRETERQREIDEALLAKLEALEASQPGLAVEHIPAPATPIVGELLPRETSKDEVSQ